MPKSQYIDPKKVFQPGYIHFDDIPVNQYAKTLDEEKALYSKDDMMRIYRDMRIIREFETMLGEIKTKSVYNGVEYSNPGPAHLSVGQEASAVGEAYSLDINDFTFGSHRSHGEILAKGLSSIYKLDDTELYDIMKEFLGGRILNVVEGREEVKGNIKELAIDFLLYGALAEIFARTTGFNEGLGGSMHAFFIPFGIFPNNAIVGGSAPVALGAALYKRANKKKGIVIANFGDGACGRGPVLESFNMSGMDQIRQLWGETDNGNNPGLPILFNIFDNFYGMGGQTMGETMAFGMAARLGAGFNPEQMHAERVNGYDPFAVIDAVTRKKELLLRGEGPALLDVVTYRVSGHSASDASTYRSEEELEEWRKADPIRAYKEKLIIGGVASSDEFDAIDETIIRRMTKICRLAIDETLSPRMDLEKDPDAIARIMYSNGHKKTMEEGREPEVLMPKADNPRVKSLALKARWAFDENGKTLPKAKTFGLRDALFESIIDKFYEDPTLIAYGEDNRDWGGAYAVYRGLTEALPYHRFFNAPISESAIIGSSVGYAMCGGRVIVELMYADFIGCAGDEIFNQVAKWQSMSAGILKMPIIIRVSVGSKYGAQHSQDWTALTAHIPGLKVVFPASPYDAKGLMNAALNGTDPVIFFESQRIYDIGEQFHKGGVPTDEYEVTLGEPDVKREGKDVTILTIGAVLYRGLEAAKTLEEKYGISAEVIDARSIVPFDYSKVIESVKKTGKIVIVGDACERGSVMKDMAADIAELAFDYLDAPPVAFGSRNWITPCHELEKYFFPQADGIIDVIHEKLMPIPGYVAKLNVSDVEKIDRSRKGL
ncbi:MAG: thiamine pyrophosphate-dependent enzyme [Clostridiales bacterium]|nr:thiamine pyrophosphate-dependent enzyme [Clostridiales bacterium]MDY4435308.1 thiamine pyrophosphate-dependent enzyme [Candidatus Flemingibacterium sp.]